MRLSILDFFGTPPEIVLRAQTADELGFHRYWLGEHHSKYQCANPLLLCGLIAGTTQRIRVGSGGVCLAYHSPFRIAEDARMLECFYPGRVDLGVTRGLKPDPNLLSWLTDGQAPQTLPPYDKKVAALHALLTDRFPSGMPPMFTYLNAAPPLWLLGVTHGAAEAAGRLGVGFAFSVYHAKEDAPGPEIIQTYRRAFQPSPEFSAPACLVVVGGACANSHQQAWASLSVSEREFIGKHGLIGGRVTFLGDPAECYAAVAGISERFQVDEVMLLALTSEHQDEAFAATYGRLAKLVGQPIQDRGA